MGKYQGQQNYSVPSGDLHDVRGLIVARSRAPIRSLCFAAVLCLSTAANSSTYRTPC